MPNWIAIEDASPEPLRVWLWQDASNASTDARQQAQTREQQPEQAQAQTQAQADNGVATEGSSSNDNHNDKDKDSTKNQRNHKAQDDVWMPLRRVDCQALNKNPHKKCLVEGSRATADPVNNVIQFNFYRCPHKRLTSAVWYVREDPVDGNPKKPKLVPLSNLDESKAEHLYRRAVANAASFGDGIDDLLKEEISMEDPNFCMRIAKSDGNLVLQKCAKGWFGKTYTLQRGYGVYHVAGEEDELLLGPVRNVIFVVHGIGEALWTKNTVHVRSSMDEVNGMRRDMYRKQVQEWKKKCDMARRKQQRLPPPPTRTEFIPIQWYDRIHSSSSSLMRSVRATTLHTIPAMRAIANDCIFDVLMYLTPNFCHEVLECVTEQIHENYLAFQKCHPDFYSQKGQCALIGHSLGSVICWDLLSILQEKSKLASGFPSSGIQSSRNGEALEVVYRSYSSDEGMNQQAGSWGPSLSEPLKHCLPFVPEFTLFLGSPVGLFLTLRGAHAVFEELEQIDDDGNAIDSNAGSNANATADSAGASGASSAAAKKQETAIATIPMMAATPWYASKKAVPNIPKPQPKPIPVSPFTLPTGSLYNIFHPSDPVAYRIEPLLLPQETPTEKLPPPLYLTRQGQDVRLHVKAGQVVEEIRKSIVESTASLGYFMNMVSGHAKTVIDAIDRHANELDDPAKKKDSPSTAAPAPPPLAFPLAGRSTQNRIDYQLQPRAIDNEYITAVTAHGCYFSNEDILDFLMDITAHSEPSDDDAAREVANSEAQRIFDAAAAQTATDAAGDTKPKDSDGKTYKEPIVLEA